MSFKFSLKWTIISLWIAFSLAYIGYDLFSKFQNNIIRNYYYAGQEDTVTAMIKALDAKECKTISLMNKEDKKQMEVVNVECVKTGISSTSGSGSTVLTGSQK